MHPEAFRDTSNASSEQSKVDNEVNPCVSIEGNCGQEEHVRNCSAVHPATFIEVTGFPIMLIVVRDVQLDASNVATKLLSKVIPCKAANACNPVTDVMPEPGPKNMLVTFGIVAVALNAARSPKCSPPGVSPQRNTTLDGVYENTGTGGSGVALAH